MRGIDAVVLWMVCGWNRCGEPSQALRASSPGGRAKSCERTSNSSINRELAVLGLWIAVDFVFFLCFRQWPICGIVGQEEAVSTSPGGSAVDVRAVELCVVPEDAGRYGGTEHRLCGRVLLPEQEYMGSGSPLGYQIIEHTLGTHHSDKSVIGTEGQRVVGNDRLHARRPPSKEIFQIIRDTLHCNPKGGICQRIRQKPPK